MRPDECSNPGGGLLRRERFFATQVQNDLYSTGLCSRQCNKLSSFSLDLAATFETVAALGAKKGFYSGRIADAIVQAVKDYDGVLDHADLAHHKTATEEPISRVFRGYRVYETPPPTHGLAVLIALGILEKVCPYPASVKNVKPLFLASPTIEIIQVLLI